jgi:NAD(P)H-hydrate epimerase
MNSVTTADVKKLHLPKVGSHKGQNGRLLIIGGSHLFHAASIWALEVASRIVDLVHYSSVPENNEIVMEVKKQFRDGIVIPRDHIDEYIEEDDCVLIGPGMVRDSETETLTNTLLRKHASKQWVIDAGALQMMDISLIPQNAILTPHHGEFRGLWEKCQMANAKCPIEYPSDEDGVKWFAKHYRCIVLLKGQQDIAASPKESRMIEGGNEGMTKGGTGDVLAGLIAALACKNDPFLATTAGSVINKTAGDELYRVVGPFFNASDLAAQIPKTMRWLVTGV